MENGPGGGLRCLPIVVLGSVSTILHEKLGYRKVCARWVPHMLTEDQKRGRVDWCRQMLNRFNGGESQGVWEIVSGDETWVYSFDPETKQQSLQWTPAGAAPPVKFRRERSAAKQMVAVFVAKRGPVTTVPLDTQRTVTANWYVEHCLPKVFEAVVAHRPRTRLRGLLLHHDNAPAHRARQTKDFLAENRIQELSHPPYSPDLAPCDFFVFPQVKSQLRGIRYNSPEEAVEAFIGVMEDIPTASWASCFTKWFERMVRCIEAQGGVL